MSPSNMSSPIKEEIPGQENLVVILSVLDVGQVVCEAVEGFNRLAEIYQDKFLFLFHCRVF